MIFPLFHLRRFLDLNKHRELSSYHKEDNMSSKNNWIIVLGKKSVLAWIIVKM
jgi:hypothetical protein